MTLPCGTTLLLNLLLDTLLLVAEVIQQVATLGGGNCKAVATLILDIVGVALNPHEAYLVAAEYA